MFWKRMQYRFPLDEGISLATPVEELSFMVLDTETTGFAIDDTDRLLEIGAVYVDRMQVSDKIFQSYVDPQRHIPEIIQQLTGIDQSKVEKAPKAKVAIDALFEFVGDCRCHFLLGHHMVFDISVIEQELKRTHCSCGRFRGVDTLDLLQLLNLRTQGHDLDDYAQAFEIPLIGRHTAVGDAVITAHLACRLLHQLARRYYTWGELLFALEKRKRCFGM